MARASKIADDVMAVMAAKVVPGVTELELASEVDYQLRAHGSRTPSFDTGVFAMGPNDHRPRLRRSASARRVLEEGDCGLASTSAAWSTATARTSAARSTSASRPSEFVRCHEIVVAGRGGRRRGREARRDRGRGRPRDARGHRRGRLRRVVPAPHRALHRARHARAAVPLGRGRDRRSRPAMAFTIEPSIFWPGRVGVRVEDLYVLEPDGCRNLNLFHHDVLASC